MFFLESPDNSSGSIHILSKKGSGTEDTESQVFLIWKGNTKY